MKKLFIFICLIVAAFAYAKGPNQEGKPPKEAISACAGKDTGIACEMKTPRGDTLSGTCKNTPDKKYFVCMPDNMPERPPKN